jgi:hypothetical protein
MSTAAELITLTRNLLNDNVNYEASSPGIESAQSFSATMYLDAVNFACKQYALKTNATYVEAAITAATVTSTLAVPTDILNPIRVTASNKVLVPSSYEFESLKNPQWSSITVSSTVTRADRWIRQDNSNIRLIPAEYNVASYKLCYTQMPTVMTANASNVDSRIYVQHQDYLKFAAGAYLLQFRGDEHSLRLADQYMKVFESLVATSGVVK